MASTISAGTTSGTALNMSGDTSGNLQFQTQAGANTITIANQTGTLNAAGPAFSVYQSSAQTLSSSTQTLIQFQTKEFDTASAFNATGSTVGTAAAYSFNPQIAGYYQINSTISNSTTSCGMRLTFFKNGSQFKITFDTLGSAVTNSINGSTVLYLNGSSDYVQVYAYWGTGQAMGASASTTFFNGCYLRGA